MIFDDLQLQNDILKYLYEHVDDDDITYAFVVHHLGDGNEKFDMKVHRQLVILKRKGLVRVGSFDTVAIPIELTGKGCEEAESILVQEAFTSEDDATTTHTDGVDGADNTDTNPDE